MPSIQINGNWYDFEPTTDPEVAKTYNGFISPSGEFYKVNKKMAHYTSHDLWAKTFMKEKKLKTGLIGSDYVKILRQKYGFLLYTHNIEPNKKNEPLVYLPLKKMGGYTMSPMQAKMLYDVMKLNNELEYYPNGDYGDELRDKVFRDAVERNIKNDKL